MNDIDIIKSIGEQVGYGHLMCVASALWRKSLKEKGIPEDGAFVPMIPAGIKDDWFNEGELENYDKIILKTIV